MLAQVKALHKEQEAEVANYKILEAKVKEKKRVVDLLEADIKRTDVCLVTTSNDRMN